MPATRIRPRPAIRTLLITGAVMVALATATAAWLFGRSAPAAVDIARAAETIDTTAIPAGTAGSVDGTWVVDTSIGAFSVTDTTGTFVGFRIQEELANVGTTEAVGRTPQVTGSLTIEDGTLIAADVTADLTGIVSNEPRRDDRIQQALETGTHPTAAFILTEPVSLDDISEGRVAEISVTGTLTVHGVAHEVTVPLQAVLQGDTVVVTGSFKITFADHDVEVPTAPMVLSVQDHGDVELQLYLTRP